MKAPSIQPSQEGFGGRKGGQALAGGLGCPSWGADVPLRALGWGAGRDWAQDGIDDPGGVLQRFGDSVLKDAPDKPCSNPGILLRLSTEAGTAQSPQAAQFHPCQPGTSSYNSPPSPDINLCSGAGKAELLCPHPSTGAEGRELGSPGQGGQQAGSRHSPGALT